MAEKEKNVLKPGWELTFVSENILTQAIALWIAAHEGELPSEEILHKMTKSAVEGSIFFNKHKKKYGIHDRVTDALNEEE